MARFVSNLLVLAILSFAGCEPGTSAPGTPELSSASGPPPAPPEATPLPPIMRPRVFEKKQLPFSEEPLLEGPLTNTAETQLPVPNEPLPEGPLTNTADLVANTSQVRRLVGEYITVSNEMAAGLQNVSDAESAARAAPTVQPLIDRQEALGNELAAIRVEIGDDNYQRAIAPDRVRINEAALRSLSAHTKILSNPQLLFAWKRAVASTGSATAAVPPGEAGDPVDSYLALGERFIDMTQQICNLLAGATDPASGRAAAEQIRTMLPDYESANRKRKTECHRPIGRQRDE